MPDTVDDHNARRYLEKLQEQVGRGEISLSEYERLSGIIATNTTGGPEAGAHAAERANHEVEPARRGKSPVRIAFDVTVTAWAAAVAINVAVWGIVSFSVDNLYFWPIWVMLPGIIFAVIWVAAGFGKKN